MPADGGSSLRRAMDKEEGRSLGAGNPAEIRDVAARNRCALEYRKNVRRQGVEKVMPKNGSAPGFSPRRYVTFLSSQRI